MATKHLPRPGNNILTTDRTPARLDALGNHVRPVLRPVSSAIGERRVVQSQRQRIIRFRDALPFEGNPNGKFLGYNYMALPFTEPTMGDPPTGDQAWTCFLNAANFKGPIAYYIPETWSKIGKLFNYPFIYGRGLDARPGNMGGGAMEINTVPRFDGRDANGVVYSKLPNLQFPVDDQGRTLLVQDVTHYSKAALYDDFKAWRDGGPVCSGRFDENGGWIATLTTRTTRYDQDGHLIEGVENVFVCGACSGLTVPSIRLVDFLSITNTSETNGWLLKPQTFPPRLDC